MKCRQCGQELKEDIGLIRCGACGGLNAEEDAGNQDRQPMPPPEPLAPPSDSFLQEDKVISDSAPSISAEFSQEGPAALKNIEDYGNSEISNAFEGFYLYDLWISDIDSADVRGKIEEVLQDKRFAFDSARLMKSLQDGCLKISKINPVKASQLLKNLQDLPVKIEWKQNAIVSD